MSGPKVNVDVSVAAVLIVAGIAVVAYAYARRFAIIKAVLPDAAIERADQIADSGASAATIGIVGTGRLWQGQTQILNDIAKVILEAGSE